MDCYDQKNDLIRRLPGYTDKGATEELGRRIERLSAAAAARQEPDADLRQWIEGLPATMRERLLAFHLIDGKRAAAAQPLTVHVTEYEADLAAQGAKPSYTKLTAVRLRAVFEMARMRYWSDITPSKVQNAIDRIRHNGQPLKQQSKNHYVTAVKSFCNWMVADGRAETSPVTRLKKRTVTDATERRAATRNELRRIMEAAAAGPDYRWGGGKGAKKQPYQITGAQRALLYRLAAETGLRASELASLTRVSFSLDTLPYSVTAHCGYTKNKRAATIPLNAATAELLREHLAYKMPAEPAFDVPPATASMLRRDAEAGGVAYEDAAGRVLDFHALRHTFITNVANSGASLKTTQELARHSDPKLTIGRYAHTTDEQKQAAIDALPDLAPLDAVAQATGTDGEELRFSEPQTWPSHWPELGDPQRPGTTRAGADESSPNAAQDVIGKGDKSPDGDPSETRPGGLEPPTCGLGNRRSILLSYGRCAQVVTKTTLTPATPRGGGRVAPPLNPSNRTDPLRRGVRAHVEGTTAPLGFHIYPTTMATPRPHRCRVGGATGRGGKQARQEDRGRPASRPGYRPSPPGRSSAAPATRARTQDTRHAARRQGRWCNARWRNRPPTWLVC